MTLPVAGFMVGNVLPDTASTNLLLMNNCTTKKYKHCLEPFDIIQNITTSRLITNTQTKSMIIFNWYLLPSCISLQRLDWPFLLTFLILFLLFFWNDITKYNRFNILFQFDSCFTAAQFTFNAITSNFLEQTDFYLNVMPILFSIN